MTDDVECPDCGHPRMDTADINDALADDPHNDYFCVVCGALFTEGEV